MTIEEAKALYQEKDIERLSLIITLHDIGLTGQEVEQYMKLSEGGAATKQQRLAILNKRRVEVLDEIHVREAQLIRLDNLRRNVQAKA